MTTATLRLATVTMEVGQPVYCRGCVRRTTLGVTLPTGFRTMRSSHTYTFSSDGVLVIVCGVCADTTVLRIDMRV